MAIQQINEIDDIPVGQSKSCNTPGAGIDDDSGGIVNGHQLFSSGLAPAIRRHARYRERHAHRGKSRKAKASRE
jgi:hypothetical protein